MDEVVRSNLNPIVAVDSVLVVSAIGVRVGVREGVEDMDSAVGMNIKLMVISSFDSAVVTDAMSSVGSIGDFVFESIVTSRSNLVFESI